MGHIFVPFQREEYCVRERPNAHTVTADLLKSHSILQTQLQTQRRISFREMLEHP